MDKKYITLECDLENVPGKNSSFDERLRFCLDQQGRTASDVHKYFTEQMHQGKGYETVLNWTKKKNNEEPQIYLKDAVNLANFLNVEPLWLLTGNGPYQTSNISLEENTKKNLSIDEIRHHLQAIDFDYIPIHVSYFNPFICHDFDSLYYAPLTPNTSLKYFIETRYGDIIKKVGIYGDLLRFVLHTSISGIFPNWFLKRISESKFNLRMFYVTDDSMSPMLNEGSLVIVNTQPQYLPQFGCFPQIYKDVVHQKKIIFKNNGIYAFVSLFGKVFFRKVQTNCNGTSIKLIAEKGVGEEVVSLSEIGLLPENKIMLDDVKYFICLGLRSNDKYQIEFDQSDEMYKKYNGYEKLSDMPEYQKLFLIGEVAFVKPSLPAQVDPAYRAYSDMINNIEGLELLSTPIKDLTTTLKQWIKYYKEEYAHREFVRKEFGSKR